VAACDLWHDSYVLVVLAVAALAVLGCVVAVALGHGGEMTEFPPDVPPLDLPEAGRLTAVDFMSLRIPVALVGYHTQSVDETLRRAATALSERDTRIAILEQRVAELLAGRLQARQEVYAKPAKPPKPWPPKSRASPPPACAATAAPPTNSTTSRSKPPSPTSSSTACAPSPTPPSAKAPPASPPAPAATGASTIEPETER